MILACPCNPESGRNAINNPVLRNKKLYNAMHISTLFINQSTASSPPHLHKMHFWIIKWPEIKKVRDWVYYAVVTVRNVSVGINKWKVTPYK